MAINGNQAQMNLADAETLVPPEPQTQDHEEPSSIPPREPRRTMRLNPRVPRRTPYVNEDRCRRCHRSATMLTRTINHRDSCPEVTGIDNDDYIFDDTVATFRNR